MREIQELQEAMRTAQGPTTDENRWERAAAQFRNIRMSEGQRFPQDQDLEEQVRTTKVPRQKGRNPAERRKPVPSPGKQDVSPEDRKVDIEIKKQEDFEDPLGGRKPKESMEEFRQRIFAWQQRGTEFRTQERFISKAPTRKVTNRPRAGTPRAKWLTELEEEEDIGIPTRFAERHTKGCDEAAMKRYFLKDRSYTLNELYRKWYRQRQGDDWEEFNAWLDGMVIPDHAMSERQMGYIKGALIATSKNLEDQTTDWRIDLEISVPAQETATFRQSRERFELQADDEPRVDPKHPAHHTLAWIACVDDMCEMHKAPKVKNRRYPTRMWWAPDERKYRNAKYMHGWHPVETQEEGDLRLQPGRFLTEECLDGRQWWECPENTCPWHIEEKKRTRHWPVRMPKMSGSSSQQSGKVEAHGTRGNQW
jgi:hypothetical protein